jgi:acetoacetate decarboxylase
MSITDNLTVARALIGKGELNLTETNGEELHALAPKGSSPRFAAQLSCSVSDLNIPEDQGS